MSNTQGVVTSCTSDYVTTKCVVTHYLYITFDIRIKIYEITNVIHVSLSTLNEIII